MIENIALEFRRLGLVLFFKVSVLEVELRFSLCSLSHTFISSVFMLGSLFYLHINSNRQLVPSIVRIPLGGTRVAQWSIQFSWDRWVRVRTYSEKVFPEAG